MVTVRIVRKSGTEVVACDYAHVRDGCLVYAAHAEPNTVRYVPVGRLVEFTIATEEPVGAPAKHPPPLIPDVSITRLR
jgi:hypothetical protein